jgi:hypothetical protein
MDVFFFWWHRKNIAIASHAKSSWGARIEAPDPTCGEENISWIFGQKFDQALMSGTTVGKPNLHRTLLISPLQTFPASLFYVSPSNLSKLTSASLRGVFARDIPTRIIYYLRSSCANGNDNRWDALLEHGQF